MKILLTGSSGRLGTAVLQEAARFGQEHNIDFEFVGLDARESTFASSIEFHKGSFTDSALIEQLLPGCDAIIHTAAYHGGFLKDHTPTEFVEVNVGGLATMLEACVKFDVKRFVFSSTMEVLIGRDWAASGMARMDESCPPRCDSIYSQSKLQCESLGQFYASEKGIEFVALRYQNIDPPNSSPLGLLARGVTAADTARSNLHAAIAKNVSYEMMLIGPASPITNQDIVKAQTDPEAVLEKYWPGASKVLLEQDLKLSPNCFWPAVNINHARRVLGWEPEQTFEKWLREQGWEDDSH
jgi:nucleoside-diphosphate-sugar epimerase